LGVAQILRTTATAPACDRRNIFFAQIMYFSHKMSLNVKIFNFFFSFFSSVINLLKFKFNTSLIFHVWQVKKMEINFFKPFFLDGLFALAPHILADGGMIFQHEMNDKSFLTKFSLFRGRAWILEIFAVPWQGCLVMTLNRATSPPNAVTRVGKS
jgi:hypothetical protein